MFASLPIALLTPFLAPQAGALSDWTIAAGQTVEFNAGAGLVEVQNLTIEAGARLRFIGRAPVNLRVHGRLRLDGTLDNSGSGFTNGAGVVTFNSTNLQEPGRLGGPGGASGGTGNVINFASSPVGGAGGGPSGGLGGESAFALLVESLRRPGGGGGGGFAAGLPLVHPDPFHPSNNGRVARRGTDGSASASSAVHPLASPLGGAAGVLPFVDGDPANDFWGRRIDPISHLLVTGELAAPRGGSGGGAGGNSVWSAVFPNPNWSPTADEKGSGGAGGGGLLIVRAQLVEIGPLGKVTVDGGRGGTGENTSGLNGIGGGSGGGSGGMFVLSARRVDLSAASDACLSSLGGDGGRGANNQTAGIGGGGDGGPGLIQLHLANGIQDVVLPAGRTLADLSVPEAYVLLPQPGL